MGSNNKKKKAGKKKGGGSGSRVVASRAKTDDDDDAVCRRNNDKKKNQTGDGDGDGDGEDELAGDRRCSQEQHEEQEEEEEEETLLILAELRTKARSLLASMNGVSPDGAPFAVPQQQDDDEYDGENSRNSHPLSVLYESVVGLLDRLMRLQREGTMRRRRWRRRRRRKQGRNVDEDEDKVVEQGGNDDDDRSDGECDSDADDEEKNVSCEIYVGADVDRDDPSMWDNFARWLSRCGIDPLERNFPVEVRRTDDGDSGGYGLFATRDIGYGETVLKVPVPSMICPYWTHRLSSSPSPSVSEDGGGDHNDDDGAQPTSPPPPLPPPFDPNRPKDEDERYRPLCLITHLINERWKGDASPFKPYLDALPRSYDTPLYWSASSTMRLSRTSHLKRAVTMQALIAWEYIQMRDALLKREEREWESSNGVNGGDDVTKHNRNDDSSPSSVMIPASEFTYELFRWATATAHTRQNLVPFVASSLTPEIQHAHAFVPFWDLINHEDSDRACRSVLTDDDEQQTGNSAAGVVEKTENGGGQRGVLACRTPEQSHHNRQEGEVDDDSDPCFRKGEQVTMHYGERSSAQLLFHSGFLHVDFGETGPFPCASLHSNACDPNNLVSNVVTDSSSEDGNSCDLVPLGGIHIRNLNRNDHCLLRVALPPAQSDGGLDRVREMVAAQYGFQAYANQSCVHEGHFCAKAAAHVICGDDSFVADSEHHEGESSSVDSRGGCIVMTELVVSPHEPCTEEVKKALLVCLASKDELAALLRVATKNSPNDAQLPRLGEKHISYVSSLVKQKQLLCRGMKPNAKAVTSMHLTSKSGGDGIWASEEKTGRLVWELAQSDQVTLLSWLKALRIHVLTQFEQPNSV